MTPRVLVVGAGAVGSWVGAALAAGGASVTLVARGPQRAAVEAGGLTAYLDDGAVVHHIRPHVAADVAAAMPLGPFDAAVVAVKSYATASAAAELAAAGRFPHVVSPQNGVGNEAVLAAALPASTIVAATLTTGVRIDRPGVVVGGRKGGVGLAAGVDAGFVPLFAGRLVAGGLVVRLYPDGVAMKWSKLLLNLLGGATCAILGWPPGRALADRRVFEVERRAWLEALSVMRAAGIRPVALPGYPVPLFARAARLLPGGWLYTLAHRRLARGRGDRLPGVAADIAAGRRETEIDVLNGAVVRAGRAHGVPTPVNAALTTLVADLAAGRADPARYHEDPLALLAAVGIADVTA